MNGQPTDRRWQLQEAEGRGKQWNLLDSEQDLDDRWQLQADDEYANYQGNNWQPIDNLPEERSGSSNWVLPSLVLVAVLAVAVYVAIAGFDGIGLNSLSNLFAGSNLNGTPESVANSNNTGEPEVTTPVEPTSAVAADQPATPTEVVPTATPELPTSTPAPMIDRRIATVREQYGVNARSSPSTVGDPVEIVPQGTQLSIWDEQTNSEGSWYYVSLPNNTLAWVTASFVDVASTPITYDEMNALRQQQNLPLIATPTSAIVVSEVPVEPTATPISNSVVVSEPLTTPPSAPLAVSAAISSPLGLNLRQAPDAAATAITLLADSLTFPVVGRSEDGAWLQLQLSDATLGWAAAEFLRVQGDVGQLPVGGASTTLPTTTNSTTPITTTESLSTTTVLTATTPLTATNGVTATTPATSTLAGEAIATITFLSGSRVRELPQEDSADVTVLDFGAEAKALGRTEDSTFIQIQLADGKTGWVVANTIELNNPVDSLPVVVP